MIKSTLEQWIDNNCLKSYWNNILIHKQTESFLEYKVLSKHMWALVQSVRSNTQVLYMPHFIFNGEALASQFEAAKKSPWKWNFSFMIQTSFWFFLLIFSLRLSVIRISTRLDINLRFLRSFYAQLNCRPQCHKDKARHLATVVHLILILTLITRGSSYGIISFIKWILFILIFVVDFKWSESEVLLLLPVQSRVDLCSKPGSKIDTTTRKDLHKTF